MKKILILYAHPNKEGHCGAILKTVESKLKERSMDYEIIDLYEIGYNPVLLPEEHYTSGHKNISEENQRYQALIKSAEKIVFIYPTWWNGMPAILKGFVDRVFVSRFAFYYEKKLPVGLLKGKKAIVLTSTGAPRILTRILMGDISTKVMVKHILGFCGIKAQAFYISNAVKYTSNKETKIKDIVKKGFSYLGV